MTKVKYPIGLQSFSEIIEKGYVYVDKTRYIDLLKDWGKYFFLGRPRRFGKSLFVSTLQAYFEGKKELFEGLEISRVEYDWPQRPVLHIDFAGENYTGSNSLNEVLNRMFSAWEEQYDCRIQETGFGVRFGNIIKSASEKTGEKVVILVDEYDKPLLETIKLPDLQDEFRNQLRGIYGNLKKMDSYIEFAFLTGITRFGKLNIFSDTNNLKDISMVPEFSGICGITTDELHQYFESSVKAFAQKTKVSEADMYETLKFNYDGYHFSPLDCPDIYNPYSLLNSLQEKNIGEYWFGTGTPFFLIDRIKAQAFELEELKDVEVEQSDIENIPFNMEGNPIPILYQSGYLTIKAYDSESKIITLSYPNREVERGFLKQLLLVYMADSKDLTPFSLLKLKKDVENGNIDTFMERLKSFFASINYDSFDLLKLEQHYQNVIYLLFKLLGYYCHTEYKTSDGRIDLIIGTKKFLYIFEFKLDKSAQEAVNQINAKEYMLPFKFDSRKVYKIGVNFNSSKRNIDDYIIEPL